MRSKRNTAGTMRVIVQITVFILIFLISISKWLLDKGIRIPFLPDASLHAVCPFGGVATIYEFATAGTFIQKFIVLPLS